MPKKVTNKETRDIFDISTIDEFDEMENLAIDNEYNNYLDTNEN